MRVSSILPAFGAVFGLLAAATPAHAILLNLGPVPQSNQTGQTITFGTAADDGMTNPSYQLAPGFTVSFGSTFVGQMLTSSADDGGLYYLTGTAPSGPLTLANDPDNVSVITTDASTTDPDNERLAGAAPGQFLGPIAVRFSTPVQQVGFKAGVFSEANDLFIQAFTAAGTSLGTITNGQAGEAQFLLADSGGQAIAGLSFYLPDNSLNGFSIDDVSVSADVPGVVPVPEPGSLGVLGASLVLGLLARRRPQRG